MSKRRVYKHFSDYGDIGYCNTTYVGLTVGQAKRILRNRGLRFSRTPKWSQLKNKSIKAYRGYMGVIRAKYHPTKKKLYIVERLEHSPKTNAIGVRS